MFNIRCLFRMVFVLPNPAQLLENDLASFEYLFQQCCNDVVQERFTPRFKHEIAIQLALLHIYIHALNNDVISYSTSPTKINLKVLDQEYGLENFVPLSLYESLKRKELIRLLTYSMKMNQNMFKVNNANETKSKSKQFGSSQSALMTSVEAKLSFLKILSDLPCFGAKVFISSANDNEQKNEDNFSSCTIKVGVNNGLTVLNERLVLGPKHGLGYFQNLNSLYPVTVIKLEYVGIIKVTKQSNMSLFDVDVYSMDVNMDHFNKTTDKKSQIEPDLSITLEKMEAEEFILMVKAYNALLINKPNASHNVNESLQLISNSLIKVIWDIDPEWWNDGG